MASGSGLNTNEHDWYVYGGSFANLNLTSPPKSGQMRIKMVRRTTQPGGNTAPSIYITVAGDYANGNTFKTSGTVRITCP